MAAKYITIAREIKKRIITQQYAANEPLPDQFALAAEFSTSRMTIQQAMRQLIVEGLVYTRQGQGTFIRKNFLQLSQWDLRQRLLWGDQNLGTFRHGDEPGGALRTSLPERERAGLADDKSGYADL